jgi:hypothetical protein
MDWIVFGIEIILHFIQPYPNVSSYWSMIVLGNFNYYSVNAILFSFSTLRLYVCVKIIKYWSLYTEDKSRRILNFFKNSKIYYFLYKACIKQAALISVVTIFAAIVYWSGLIFKVYEDFDPSSVEKNLNFTSIFNCLWFLMCTVTTSKIFILIF